MDAALLSDPTGSKPTVLLLLLLLSLASALQTRLQSVSAGRRVVPLETAVPVAPAGRERVEDARVAGSAAPTLPPRDGEHSRHRRGRAAHAAPPEHRPPHADKGRRRLPIVLRPVRWAVSLVGSVLRSPVRVAIVAAVRGVRMWELRWACVEHARPVSPVSPRFPPRAQAVGGAFAVHQQNSGRRKGTQEGAQPSTDLPRGSAAAAEAPDAASARAAETRAVAPVAAGRPAHAVAASNAAHPLRGIGKDEDDDELW